MVSYELQESRGDPISADTHLSIYQYPDSSSDDSECEAVMLDALTTACDQLYENTIIGYYEISITYDHPGIAPFDDSAEEMHDEFKNDYLPGEDPPRGSHLLVTDETSDGWATYGDGGPTSFNDWMACVMGTGSAEQFWKNGGIQEILHTSIDQNVVSDKFIDDSHHDLGKVYDDSVDDTSPMCSSYEETHGPHGSCNNDASFDEAYVTTLTQCAIDAVDQTALEYT